MQSRRAKDGSADRVLVVGAGVGGLVAAFELAAWGYDVTVLERAASVGGKLRRIPVAGRLVDTGPTVLTMRWVFERLLADHGSQLATRLALTPADVIARHAWQDGSRLDLFSDVPRSADAIGAVFGGREAQAYVHFARTARKLYEALKPTFIEASQPSMVGLAGRMARVDPASLVLIKPGATLWQVIEKTFTDPRLRQLFGRYATYCGSSPYSAQATLMLVAHVEQEGVSIVDGGMHAIADMLADLVRENGGTIRLESPVARVLAARGRVRGVELETGEVIEAGNIVLNCDAEAVSRGILGEDVRGAVPRISPRHRSLSALTFSLVARTDGFPLSHHNVFFSRDYRAEFEDILARGRLPSEPTVYLCAQDRQACADGDGAAHPRGSDERALILINAPARGDSCAAEAWEVERCWETTLAVMRRCGLDVSVEPDNLAVTTPTGFNGLFPGTGGALYGRNSHGWDAAFQRPGNRTRIPGLYLAGGSVHPGPGVPMAALSGRQAAASLRADRGSIRSSRPVATSGGISMP